MNAGHSSQNRYCSNPLGEDKEDMGASGSKRRSASDAEEEEEDEDEDKIAVDEVDDAGADELGMERMPSLGKVQFSEDDKVSKLFIVRDHVTRRRN